MGWSPPSDPFYKLNFDATFDSKKRFMGIGINVVRNSRGEALIVVFAPRSHVCSAFYAECYALLRSINLCEVLDLHQVVIKGDAKVVVEGVNGYNTNCSQQGQLIDDIQHLLTGHADWKLNFAKRSGNKATHITAKLGMYLQLESVWIEDGPPEVMSAILLEMPCTD